MEENLGFGGMKCNTIQDHSGHDTTHVVQYSMHAILHKITVFENTFLRIQKQFYFRISTFMKLMFELFEVTR